MGEAQRRSWAILSMIAESLAQSFIATTTSFVRSKRRERSAAGIKLEEQCLCFLTPRGIGLKAFRDSAEFSSSGDYNKIALLMVPGMADRDRERAMSEAVESGALTLMTKEFGRGFDFMRLDKGLFFLCGNTQILPSCFGYHRHARDTESARSASPDRRPWCKTFHFVAFCLWGKPSDVLGRFCQ